MYLNEWLNEQNAGMTGWDWSRLDGRVLSDTLPWDYRCIVLRHLKPEHKLLDMGTGGGEFLLTLGHAPHLTTVTEGWAPNLELCRKTLAPQGIRVVEWEEPPEPLPFDDAEFDMVVNRHDCYDPSEILRVLKPGGLFVTQQVGGKNNLPLSAALLDGYTHAYADHDLQNELKAFKALGFSVILADEALLQTRYLDVGAVVYTAAVLPWEFPNFSVEGCYGKLCALQKKLEADGYVQSHEHRFVMVLEQIDKI